MKRIVGVLAVLILTLTPVWSAKAGVNDFYFSDFSGDYYLSKDADGISHLRVVESVAAEFPEYNQNKGICRQIPFTNQNGENVTLSNLTRSNIKVTRNGVAEPVYSIERENDYYNVCTGDNNYVLGTQVYTFEYEFTKVVTEFEENGRKFQELYWDTNGNGATQKFNKVTARLHFADIEEWTGDSWCYVGKYGEKGSDRCVIREIDDGVEFVAENLKSHENLTFDVELKAGSFVVPEPDENWAYVWITVALGAVCLLCIGLALRKFLESQDKAKYYKGLFVKPEYQPNKEYGLTEMAEIYLGKKKDVKVAMLLEMVVKRKIEFRKGEKKKWDIIVKNLDELGEEYVDLLAILNGGNKPGADDVVELKSRTANSKMMSLKRAMENEVLEDLKRDKLVESKYKIGGSSKRGVANVIAMTIILVPVIMMVGLIILQALEDAWGLGASYGGKIVFGGHYFFITALVMVTITVVICVALNDVAHKYAGHTLEGLKMSRYMEGLRLYIEMAEAERMKMLQSVKGADTSAERIVKLYEKLLPYAAVFGLEESWINEMKEYCRVEEIEEPDYLLVGLTAAQLSRTMRSAATYATTATTMTSSGGGSSSGFSGGGGGGFSGGGGGGGGFGGR